MMKKTGWNRTYTLGAAAIAVVLLLLVIGSTNANSDASAARPIKQVVLADLERAFDTNEVGAMLKYGGEQDLIVTAVVDGVALDADDDVGVRLRTIYMMPVWAHLDESSRARAGSLNEGDAVQLRCAKLEEFVGKPVLHKCTIV